MSCGARVAGQLGVQQRAAALGGCAHTLGRAAEPPAAWPGANRPCTTPGSTSRQHPAVSLAPRSAALRAWTGSHRPHPTIQCCTPLHPTPGLTGLAWLDRLHGPGVLAVGIVPQRTPQLGAQQLLEEGLVEALQPATHPPSSSQPKAAGREPPQRIGWGQGRRKPMEFPPLTMHSGNSAES